MSAGRRQPPRLFGCSVVRQVARRRVLPLLQDADCALGLLHHSQDAVEHLVEAKMIIIENDFNTSKEYIFILAYFQASAGNSAQKVGSRFLFQNWVRCRKKDAGHVWVG